MRFKYSLFYICLFLIAGCSSEDSNNSAQNSDVEPGITVELIEYPVSPLPDDLVWETNNEAPIFSSPNAKKGGVYRDSLQGFPLTIRSAGPDANGIFANYIRSYQMGLTNIHPNTNNPIPELATHWAFAEDRVTVFYKLDPNAAWSDGVPVTADDFIFTRDFMRSEYIIDPFANNWFTNEITDVQKHGQHIISVKYVTPRPENDLLFYTNVIPVARHFHKLDENWVTDYNWLVEPNTGAYTMTTVEKGKYIEFSRNENWWAKDYRYFKNRYNVDKIRVSIIREIQTSFNHFLKGELDTFWMVWPDYWHDKARGEQYDSGYIHKIQFYNEAPQSIAGLLLNVDVDLFKDVNVRYGLAHSLNIQKVIDTLLRGDYSREDTAFSGYPGYTNENIVAREFDLDKADLYFNEAGWSQRGPDGIRVKDGQRLSINLPYGQSNLTERLVLLREEAKKAGVEINLQLVDNSAFFKNLLEKKHQVAYLSLTSDFRPEYWSLFHSDNAHKANTNNFSNIDEPELDNLIDEYRFGIEEVERKRLSRDIQQKIHDLGIYIPFFKVPWTRDSYWRWVKLPAHHGTRFGKYLFPPVSDLGLFWIDEDVKNETLEAMKSGQTFEPVTIIDETYRIQ
ncbi:MAG: ABC transporter substrate-binding protein [Gammaproteobacteria bacterium]|nr:ABC transporter substrate-binding protein [Gammaproteobacteria bacterium]